MSDKLWFGKYRIVKILGEGATSKVYLAVHHTLNQYRAIKCISKENKSFEQVKQEADLLIHLKSPAIPVIYDMEEDSEYLYIIEEYMEGDTLLTYRNQTHLLPESEIIQLSLQICDLIGYLHSMRIPILYLDLKPSNLIYTKQQLKLIDFGSARVKCGREQKMNFGTRGFAAPEQYRDSKLDETTDIYGIGMLMYFLMTGTTCHQGESNQDMESVKKYSRELRHLVMRAVKHNPCERYACVQTLERNLRKLSSKKKQDMANPSKTIALIGSQKQVGVTHLAFYLLSQLQKQGRRVIYVECGISSVVLPLLPVSEKITENVISFNGYMLTRAEWLSNADKGQYDYIIYDYGCADTNNTEVFSRADIRIAVLGGQLWEKKEMIRMMAVLHKDKEVRYAVNHLTAQQFHRMVSELEDIKVYRMPCEFNPFAANSQIKELVESIVE